jgi:hypothetical protein
VDEDKDGCFPDGSPVEVRYPRNRREEWGDRSLWPWPPGSIVEQCGPDEWYACVEVRELATLEDGRPALGGTADDDLFFPCWWARLTSGDLKAHQLPDPVGQYRRPAGW